MNLFPAPRGEVSLHMDAPPEQVWALVSDVTRIGEFSPETVSYTHLTLPTNREV